MRRKLQFILGKELIEFWRSSYLVALGVVLVITLVISLWINSSEYIKISAEKTAAQQAARQEWLHQREKNPHGAGHTGTVLFKPLSPLYIVDKGLNNYQGQYVQLETHTQHDLEHRPANDQTFLLRTADFTTGFMLQYLVPLLIIFMCYASISAEREGGTLRLLLSHNISSRQMAFAKLLTSFVKLCLLLLPVYVLLSFLLWEVQGFTNHHWQRMNLLFGVYLLYYFILITICLVVSAKSHTSSQSLAVLMGFWIVTTIVLPRTSNSLSEVAYRTPSNIEMKLAFDKAQGDKYVYGYAGVNSFGNVYDSIQQGLMKQYNINNPDSLEVNPFGFAIEHTEEEGQRIYDARYGEIYNSFYKQYRLQQWANAVSPFSSVRFFSMGICGTGPDEHNAFVRQAEDYRRKMMYTLNMDIAYGSTPKGYSIKTRTIKKGSEYKRGDELWEKIPPFRYQPLSFGTVLKLNVVNIVILLVWCAAGLVWLYVASAKLKL